MSDHKSFPKNAVSTLEGKAYASCVRLGRRIRSTSAGPLSERQLLDAASHLQDDLEVETACLVEAFGREDEDEINRHLCSAAVCRDNLESFWAYLREYPYPGKTDAAWREVQISAKYFEEKLAPLLPKIEKLVQPRIGKRWWEVLAPVVITHAARVADNPRNR